MTVFFLINQNELYYHLKNYAP